MSHIIVVFPRRDNAVNIRNVLVRAGMEVSAVCLTGAKVLQYVDNWSDGIVVCGYHLQDMQYTELREALPFSFDMLLVAPPSKWMDELPEGVVGLATADQDLRSCQYSGNASAVTGKSKKEAERKKPEKK